jgi:hypothetical protein
MNCPKTCADAPNIEITQKLLTQESLPWSDEIQFTQRLGEKRIIDGKDVAVVFVKNRRMDHATPHLMCACDFHYEKQEHAHLHHIDAHSCKRKKEWYKARLTEVAIAYNDRGLSPKEIILDIFDRVVNKGEFLGQTEGDWFYVQNLGNMFAQLFWISECDEKWPFRKGLPFYEARLAQQHKLYAAVNEPPPLLSIGDFAFSFALQLVRELYQEKKLGLNGMVLIPYIEPPADVLNTARAPMVTWGNIDLSTVAGLVWVAKFDERFQIEVQRKHNEYKGVLCIFDHDAHDVLLHAVEVDLSHGARFGPDVDDVLFWELLVAEFVDKNFPKKIV